MVTYDIGNIIFNSIGYSSHNEFVWFDDGGIIFLFWVKPTENEIHALNNGKLEFELRIVGFVEYLFLKVGNYWQEVVVPFTTLDKIPNIIPFVTYIYIVDTETGRVMAKRYVSFDEKFTQGLYSIMKHVNKHGETAETYANAVMEIVQTISTDDIRALLPAFGKFCLDTTLPEEYTTNRKLNSIIKNTPTILDDKQYPGQIPTELQEYYCYVAGYGHSFLTIVKDLVTEIDVNAYHKYEIPLPVKYVMSIPYEIIDEYLTIDVPVTSGYIIDVNLDKYAEL